MPQRNYDVELTEAATKLVSQAIEQGVTLSCAESCTGGLIAEAITRVPGSSAVFLGGVVSYAIPVKEAVLGVPAAIINEFGVVSEQTARAMAKGAASVIGSDFSVSTTGIAGPGGAEPGKPVGTVCFGLSVSPGCALSNKKIFQGNREEVRAQAATHAINMLLDYLS